MNYRFEEAELVVVVSDTDLEEGDGEKYQRIRIACNAMGEAEVTSVKAFVRYMFPIIGGKLFRALDDKDMHVSTSVIDLDELRRGLSV